MADTVSDTPRERLAMDLWKAFWPTAHTDRPSPEFLKAADALISAGLAYRTDVMEGAARIAENPTRGAHATRAAIACEIRAKAKEPTNV